MLQVFASAGAIIAGLYLMWRDGLPVLNAYRTGVWKSQRVHVTRATEPERFTEIMKPRMTRAMTGPIVFGLGVVGLAWTVFSLWAMGAR